VKERIVVAVVMLCVKRIEDDTQKKNDGHRVWFCIFIKIIRT
jgi:hypothetical protein